MVVIHITCPLNNVSCQNPGCPPEIEIAWDAAVGLRCHFNLEFYPFDKNICHFKIGSSSFGARDLVYKANSGLSTGYRNTIRGRIHFRDLCHHLREETVLAPGPGGYEETFIVDGYSIIVEGNARVVLTKRLPILGPQSIIL